MKSGAMFGALVQYKKQEFYDAHPYLYLYTPQQSYRLDLIAGSVVDYDDAVYSTVLSADTVSALVRSSRFESKTPLPDHHTTPQNPTPVFFFSHQTPAGGPPCGGARAF